MRPARDLIVGRDDPRRPAVAAVLEAHLGEMREVTPAGGVHALDGPALVDTAVTFFSASLDGEVLGVAALRDLGAGHGEVKSMHTVARARGRGVASALLVALLDGAARQGHVRLSLETGDLEAFRPARALYERFGFEVCPPFGPYVDSPTSLCMTKRL